MEVYIYSSQSIKFWPGILAHYLVFGKITISKFRIIISLEDYWLLEMFKNWLYWRCLRTSDHQRLDNIEPVGNLK